MRGIIAALLIVVGAALVVPASVAAWQDRTLQDTDEFVSTVNEAFNQEEVQTALAARITAEIMTHAEIQDRIGAGLEEVESRSEGRVPEGLALLEGPLTRVAEEAIYRATLRLLQSEALDVALTSALTGVHTVLIAIINDDSDALTVSGDKLILNVRVIIEAVIEDIGAERAASFLEKLDLPEDAGQVVLMDKSEDQWIFTAINVLDKSNPWIPAITAVVLLSAIPISVNRRRTTMIVGAVVVVMALLSLLALLIARGIFAELVAQTPEGEEALKVAYDILLQSFRRQQWFVILIGGLMVGGGWLAGESRFASALRQRFRGQPAEAGAKGDGFLGWVRERTVALRIAGLVIGALLLLAWPDTSTRFDLTVLAVILLYLTTLTVATSTSEWAVSTRARMGEFWSGLFGAEKAAAPGDRSLGSWIARHAVWLRIIGLVLGLVLLVAWPSLTFGTVVVVIVAEFLYLAAIDSIVSRRESAP